MALNLPAMPRGGRRKELFALKGSTSELLARPPEESDKALGGTRLLTTQQLEGQQARGRRALEFTRAAAPAAIKLLRPSQAADGERWREQRHQGLRARLQGSSLQGRLQGVCLHTQTHTQPPLTMYRKGLNSGIKPCPVGSPKFCPYSGFGGEFV